MIPPPATPPPDERAVVDADIITEAGVAAPIPCHLDFCVNHRVLFFSFSLLSFPRRRRSTFLLELPEVSFSLAQITFPPPTPRGPPKAPRLPVSYGMAAAATFGVSGR